MENICKQALTESLLTKDCLSPLELSADDLVQFSRQLILKDWNLDRQIALAKLNIYLGLPLDSALLYLVASGARLITFSNVITNESFALKQARQLHPLTNIYYENRHEAALAADVSIVQESLLKEIPPTALILSDNGELAGIKFANYLYYPKTSEEASRDKRVVRLITISYPEELALEAGCVVALQVLRSLQK